MIEGPDTFTRMRDFLVRHMRMSHIYQPIMLKTLIEGGGKVSLRAIAAAFLARDQAQLEYYEVITKRMPGKVLRYQWLAPAQDISQRPLGSLTVKGIAGLVGFMCVLLMWGRIFFDWDEDGIAWEAWGKIGLWLLMAAAAAAIWLTHG